MQTPKAVPLLQLLCTFHVLNVLFSYSYSLYNQMFSIQAFFDALASLLFMQ